MHDNWQKPVVNASAVQALIYYRITINDGLSSVIFSLSV